MTRKKLPAYGAALLERRRRGDHPLCVHVVFGFRWNIALACGCGHYVPGLHPSLAIKPADYAPGVYDFGLVAGLRVEVVDQDGAAAFYEDPDLGPARPQFTRFWDLLGELAAFAADIEVRSPVFEALQPAHVLAFCMRHAGRWPYWWSDPIDEKNANRRSTWLRAVGELAGLDAVCA